MSVLSWPNTAATKINMTVATIGAIGSGAYTIVALTKPVGNHGIFGAQVTSSYDRELIVDAAKWYGAGDFSGFGTASTTQWQIIGQSKAAGSNTYRWHYWNYDAGGAKTHTAGTGAHGDPGAITVAHLGQGDNRGNGLIAWVGIWKRVLSDAEFDGACTAALQDWYNLTPDALWPCNVAAASVVDVTGHGNNASSVDGTISLSGTDPTGYSFNISSGLTQALPVASYTEAGQGFGRTKRRTLTAAATTDTAVTLGRTKRRTLVVASTADVAATLGRLKSRALTPATSADTAVAVGKRKRLDLAVAVETDTAVALGGAVVLEPAGVGPRRVTSSARGRAVTGASAGRHVQSSARGRTS